MHKQTFINGSFVVHGITHVTHEGQKCSAWFSSKGELLDAEIHRGDGYTRTVPKSWKHVREKLAAVGRIWRHAA